eukprot:UN05574
MSFSIACNKVCFFSILIPFLHLLIYNYLYYVVLKINSTCC